MAPPSGFTQLVATSIQNAAHTLLVTGTLSVLPTDANDTPITAVAGGVGGPITTDPAVFPVANGRVGPSNLAAGQTWRGVFDGNLAGGYNLGDVVFDTADNNLYVSRHSQNGGNAPEAPSSTHWTLLSGADQICVPDTNQTYPQYISYRLTIKAADGTAIYTLKGVQPTGALFTLDTYNPKVPAQAPSSPGPQGVKGDTGAPGQNGIASLPALARLFNGQLPPGANLFRASGKTLGQLIDSTTGNLIAYTGGMVTGYLPANSGGAMSLSQAMGVYSQSTSAQPGSSTANQYDVTQQSGPAAGQILDATTGGYLSGTYDGYGSSGFQYVHGLGQVSTNAPLFFGFQGKSGIAFYDANKNFLSGIASGAAGLSNFTNPYGPITVPAGAYWMRTAIVYYGSDGGNFMTVTGTTVPSTYVAYAAYPVSVYTNGLAFYDQNLSYVSGITGTSQAAQNIPVPSAAAFLRAGFLTDVSAALMVTNGAASPATYADAGYLSPSQTSALVTAALVGVNPAVSMTTLWPAMKGLACWLPFQDGAGATVADASGNGKNGTIGGDTTTPATWAGPAGLLPNSQTVSVANQNGRPTNGIVAYFPAATSNGQSGYGYMGGNAVGPMNSWRLRCCYGTGTDHGNYAMFPAIGYSNGGNGTQALNGLTGVHAIEIVIGDGGSIPDRMYLDGQEVQYLSQVNSGGDLVGGAQLTNAVLLNGTGSAALPAVIYSFWSADTRDTPAQAMARATSELARVTSLGVKVGLHATTAATDSMLAITGTSIDVGYQASQTPASRLVLGFPCTIANFAVSGQACKDMLAGFEDREATVFHPTAQRNIAYHGGVTNGVMNYQESPQNALQDVLAWNRKAKALGYKTIATTMLSRSGTGYNSQTGDALAQAFNALLLAAADEFDWVAHLAADPVLGAAGASTSATYFADGVHPNNTGQAHLVSIMQAAVQGVYGTPQTLVSGNYTVLDSDRVIVQTATAASTVTLKSALNQSFNSAGKLTVTNSGTGSLTVAASSGQTINGVATLTVAPGVGVRLMPSVVNPAAGGANWITV